MRCETRNRPFLKARNEKEKYVILFRPRCKMWKCPACAQINQRLWAARAHTGARHYHEMGRQLRFLTLTSHEKLDAEGTLAVWPKAWKKLHTRANREGGKGGYMMIPERHKNERLHMHAIVTWDMGTRWWKDNARASGLGYMAESVEIAHAGGAANYVTKYIAKTLQDLKWPPKWRRARTSRDWPKLPEPEDKQDWKFSKLQDDAILDEEVLRWQTSMYRVIVLDHIEAWEVIEAVDNQGVFVR